MKFAAPLTILLASVALAPASTASRPIGAVTSTPEDRRGIEALLATYAKAVSTKDQPLFETILLNQDIPLAYVDDDTARVARTSTADYAGFRKGVFGARPFTQSFRNVSIAQDGNLATVHLVFVNRYDATSSAWGFKTMQLLRVKGAWKIAAEFFTYH